MKKLKSIMQNSRLLYRGSLFHILGSKNFMLSRKTARVAVTYENNKMTDGAGAQLQRIYGVYALSRLINLPYIHSPLVKIGQDLAALESNSIDPAIVSRYNRNFKINSDIQKPQNLIACEVRNATLRSIRELENRARKENTFILAKILFPYGITDAYPDAYEVVKKISPFPRRSRSPSIRIAVHVRMGDLLFIESHRMLPNAYYISAVERIRGILDVLGLNYTVELHTELPTKPFVVTPSHHGMMGRLSEPIVVDPKLGKIQEFDTIPGLQKFINSDPIETIEKLATADVLIMSHSSFSYVAAILNVTGIVIYHPFWHAKPTKWLASDDSGKFSSRVFRKRLRENLEQGSID